MFQWVTSDAERPWIRWALVGFLLFVTIALVVKYEAIATLTLIDTDDNLRLAQVRDWLGGQGWYDLRQYRMEPPAGANIHWSRIPDLPIAGLILLFTPFVGTTTAEAIAAATAPLIPAIILLLCVAAVTRRIVAKGAWPIAMVAVLMATGVSNNLMPMRIDHHGWQLAMLSLAMLGFTDSRPARGGTIMGLAIALSLAIGLEMIIFLAMMGAAAVVGWLFDGEQRRRLMTLGAATAGGCALFFLLFASEANRQMMCDALSPVWLSDAMLGGALLFLIGWKSPADWRARFALAAGAGVLLAAFHAAAFPQCLSRLEGVSDEADRLWLSRVHEAKPIYQQSWRLIVQSLTLPIVGIVGYALLQFRDSGRHRRLDLTLGVITLAATALMFWQSRLGASAQLLSIPGAAGLLAFLLPKLEKSGSSLIRVLGISGAFVLATGALPVLIGNYLPSSDSNKSKEDDPNRKISRRECGTEEGMATLAGLPKGYVYTFIDIAPRVLVMTPHATVTGPYHRNDDAIAENIKTLRGTPEDARRVIVGKDADYLLICRGELSVIGRREGKEPGFSARLADGQKFDWLEEIPQPEDAPNLLYRVKAPGSS